MFPAIRNGRRGPESFLGLSFAERHRQESKAIIQVASLFNQPLRHFPWTCVTLRKCLTSHAPERMAFMKSPGWFPCLALLTISHAAAALSPVAYRLASLPASVEKGQQLLLCAANIGTGALDVSLQLISVRTGRVVAEKTVRLAPLGSGAAAAPCVTTAAEAVGEALPAADGQPLVVGVAMVRKPVLSFREAQVTASIQVLAPDANGLMHSVETIPLSRAAHPSDGAPVYAPTPADSGHHR